MSNDGTSDELENIWEDMALAKAGTIHAVYQEGLRKNINKNFSWEAVVLVSIRTKHLLNKSLDHYQ